MTSRQARTERRAAERKAKKAEIRRQKAAGLANRELPLEEDEAAHLSEPKIPSHNAAPTARTLANRANAQHSTGPTSAAGRLASSRNSLQHGLASGQVIIPGEDPSRFEALLKDLIAEHQPATATEELLVQEMAQSFWLTQRALRLQNDCFTENGVDEKRLALFLRYQTTHERAFHKALTALLKVQKERTRPSKTGFVSQGIARSVSGNGFVSQRAPEEQPFRTPTAGEGHFVRQNQQCEAA